MDNVREWTSLPELLTMASYRKGRKRISAVSSVIGGTRRGKTEDMKSPVRSQAETIPRGRLSHLCQRTQEWEPHPVTSIHTRTTRE